jgi:hypothetical protein
VRVDDLAVAPDGTLWGSRWPQRGDLLRFDAKGRAQVQVHLDAGLDSIVFGQAGTRFENLLFATSRVRTGDDGAGLYMVDLVTLRSVELARGGPGAEQIIATTDGRLLLADGEQVDVIAPLVAPKVLRATPADGALVPLPMGEISIVFDHDMLASSTSAADSVTNVANYTLTRDGVAVAVWAMNSPASGAPIGIGMFRTHGPKVPQDHWHRSQRERTGALSRSTGTMIALSKRTCPRPPDEATERAFLQRRRAVKPAFGPLGRPRQCRWRPGLPGL